MLSAEHTIGNYFMSFQCYYCLFSNNNNLFMYGMHECFLLISILISRDASFFLPFQSPLININTLYICKSNHLLHGLPTGTLFEICAGNLLYDMIFTWAFQINLEF